MPTAIVTGASKGLGRALAGALASNGWTVIIDARHEAELDATAANMPGRPVVVPGNVTDPTHRQALVDAAAARGGLDLLVNNAGTLGPTPLPSLATISVTALHELFDVNVVAPVALTQLALPLLGASRGAIVNITSDAAVEGYEGWGGYGASKAALEQVSRVLAAERPDLAVWWVDPGDMRTDMHQAAFPGEDISDRPAPEASVPGLLDLITERRPSGRYVARDLVGAP